MDSSPDVSIVMPCLNEQRSLPHCIERAREALVLIQRDYGLHGEIVIADNGSTDGSQALAAGLGARVVPVARRGYGAALHAGFTAAHGRYLIMGDADGSYDFVEAAPMIGELLAGADICMGSRFKGGIRPGAMPWKNRYIGNPVLTGILNILFGSHIDDAHCGMRAVTKAAYQRLHVVGSGMEFASEMLVKAVLLKQRIAEVPVGLYPDLRGRAPHLRPWRDGWRHLRFLLMLSPGWLFLLPGALGVVLGLAILLMAGADLVGHGIAGDYFGDYWAVLAGSMLSVSHICLLLGLAAQLYGLARGYRVPGGIMQRMKTALTIDRMLVLGLAIWALGFVVLAAIVAHWAAGGFRPFGPVLPAVVGTTLTAVGVQTALGGFLLGLIADDVPPADAG